MFSLRSRLADDSGFSLSELLIAGSLIVVVVTAAWTFSYAVTQSSKVSEARGMGARETGEPLQLAEKYVMQALAIEEASPYRLQYRIDRDLSTSGTGERHILEVTSEGELRLTTVRINAAFVAISTPHTAVLATHCVNVAQAIPLFRYYDASRAEITAMGYAPSRSRSITITLKVLANSMPHQDSRLVTLRNRE